MDWFNLLWFVSLVDLCQCGKQGLLTADCSNKLYINVNNNIINLKSKL